MRLPEVIYSTIPGPEIIQRKRESQVIAQARDNIPTNAILEALNSGKIVKATKRMYTFYLCDANSWSAVAHFPRSSQAPISPIPANNESRAGREVVVGGGGGTMSTEMDEGPARNATNKSCCSPVPLEVFRTSRLSCPSAFLSFVHF